MRLRPKLNQKISLEERSPNDGGLGVCGAMECLGLWRLLGMAEMRFGRALDGIWLEYRQNVKSTLGFSK